MTYDLSSTQKIQIQPKLSSTSKNLVYENNFFHLNLNSITSFYLQRQKSTPN